MSGQKITSWVSNVPRAHLKFQRTGSSEVSNSDNLALYSLPLCGLGPCLLNLTMPLVHQGALNSSSPHQRKEFKLQFFSFEISRSQWTFATHTLSSSSRGFSNGQFADPSPQHGALFTSEPLKCLASVMIFLTDKSICSLGILDTLF